MFYYTFTTFDCNFIPRNAEICKVSSETKNVGKAHKYRLNRHLPTYEKIIKNLYSFYNKHETKQPADPLSGDRCNCSTGTAPVKDNDADQIQDNI